MSVEWVVSLWKVNRIYVEESTDFLCQIVRINELNINGKLRIDVKLWILLEQRRKTAKKMSKTEHFVEKVKEFDE